MSTACGLSVGLLLLDTTVLIDVLRGRPAAQRVLGTRRTGTQPATSAIDRTEAKLAGGWRRDFAAKGVTLHHADCLSAAAAVGAGARLATANVKDFPIAGLPVEDWPGTSTTGRAASSVPAISRRPPTSPSAPRPRPLGAKSRSRDRIVCGRWPWLCWRSWRILAL